MGGHGLLHLRGSVAKMRNRGRMEPRYVGFVLWPKFFVSWCYLCFVVFAMMALLGLAFQMRRMTPEMGTMELVFEQYLHDLHVRTHGKMSAGNLHVAVVGNGPLSETDRESIEGADFVIRFNDLSYLRKGEKTMLRVVRHPFPLRHELIDVPVWHIAPRKGLCESHRPGRPLEICAHSNVVVFSPVYQSEYGSANELESSSRIFSDCDANNSNIHGLLHGGSSSGGLVLSHLQQSREVERIAVFGMNWNGNSSLHIDFANSSLVSGCCTKCRIHRTATRSYGNKSKTYFDPGGDDFYRSMQGI